MSTPYSHLEFPRPLARLSLLIALSASTTAMAENIDSTAAFYGQSNPGVFVTDPEETLGYIAEGASLTIVELPDGAGSATGVMPVVAQVPVDGSIMGLEVDPDGDALYVAAGSFGLLKVDIAAGNSPDCAAQDMGAADGCYPVTIIDDIDQDTGAPNDRWVFDVAVMDHPDGTLVLAAFAAKGHNELRVYSGNAARLSATSLSPMVRVKLPGSTRDSDNNPISGVAYDLAVDGTDVYVAMGIQGVVKVDLSDLSRPRRMKGPVLDAPGEDQFDQPALVRQISVAGNTLLGAANGAGLLEIDLAQRFHRNMSYATYAFSDPEEADEPAYAARIDAIDYRSDSWAVAVSTVKSPVQNVEGAPGEPSGTLSFNLIPGGYLGEYDQGSNEGIYLLTPRPDGSLLEIPVSLSAQRSIRLGNATGAMRLYVGDRKASQVRAADYGAPLIAERVREDRWGKNAPRVGPTLIDPNLLITSSDHLNALQAGFLETCRDDVIAPIPGTEGDGNMGVITNFDAQWLDSSARAGENAQWLIHGTFGNWRVQHITVGDVCDRDIPATRSWNIAPPTDEYGQRGRMSFMGHVDDRFDDDLVVLSRNGTRHGLLVYSRAAIEAAAASTSEGGNLDVDPIAQFDTHPELETWSPGDMTPVEISQFFGGSVLNFGVDLARLRDDDGALGWVSLSASGYHNHAPGTDGSDPNTAMYTHGMVTVHDLTDLSATSSPDPIAVLYSPVPGGTAAAVQVVPIGGRIYGLMADLGGAMHIFDITNVRKSGHAAPLLTSWQTPISPLDGKHELAVDIEIQREPGARGTARIYAYVSMFRGGVAVLDISDPASPIHIDTLDTPGLVEGLHFDRPDGEPRLLVADREGGIRVMRVR